MTTEIFHKLFGSKELEVQQAPIEVPKPVVIIPTEVPKQNFIENVDWRAIQIELKKQGFYNGPIDGVPSTLTREAIKRFQIENKVPVQKLGTVGPKTLKALMKNYGTELVLAPEPPWMALLNGKMGWHEKNDKKKLWDFLRSDKKSVGDPSVYPWCGDLVETCIARTLPDEPLPSNPYLARNWMKVGVGIDYFAYGCIVVFWRTHKTKSSNGHIGFGLKQYKDGNVQVRGGNQNNRISDADFAKDRILGFRWPKTWPLPKKDGQYVGGQSGALSTNEA